MLEYEALEESQISLHYLYLSFFKILRRLIDHGIERSNDIYDLWLNVMSVQSMKCQRSENVIVGLPQG